MLRGLAYSGLCVWHILVSVCLFCSIPNSSSLTLQTLRGIPHLNNTVCYEYFFRCYGPGQFLQWAINGNNLDDFHFQDAIAGVSSYYEYYGVLLSHQSERFDSVLTVILPTNRSLLIQCNIDNEFEETDIIQISHNICTPIEKQTNDSLCLTHLWSREEEDTGSFIGMFSCESNSHTQLWGLSDKKFIGFSEHDSHGTERMKRSNSSITEYAVLIREPNRYFNQNFIFSLFLVRSVNQNSTVDITCADQTLQATLYNVTASVKSNEISTTTDTDMATSKNQEFTDLLTKNSLKSTAQTPSSISKSDGQLSSDVKVTGLHDQPQGHVTQTYIYVFVGLIVTLLIVLLLICPCFYCYKRRTRDIGLFTNEERQKYHFLTKPILWIRSIWPSQTSGS